MTCEHCGRKLRGKTSRERKACAECRVVIDAGGQTGIALTGGRWVQDGWIQRWEATA